MKLCKDTIPIICEFAWGVQVSEKRLLVLLDCCIDCQKNIPPFFLDNDYWCGLEDPPVCTDDCLLWNPLISGAAFCPFQPQCVTLFSDLEYMFDAIKPDFFKTNRIRKKPLDRLLWGSALKKWNTFLKRLKTLSEEDFTVPSRFRQPKRFRKTVDALCGFITYLPTAKPIKSRWGRLL